MIRVLLLIRNTWILFLYMFLFAFSAFLGGCCSTRQVDDLAREKEAPKEIQEVVTTEEEPPKEVPEVVALEKEPLKQILQDVAQEKEPLPMIQIQKLSLTEKTLNLNYRLSNPFDDDIWVCYDIGVYDKQQIQHAATRIDGETVRIQLRGNIERFPGFVNPYSVVKYIRLKSGESCSGKIVLDLPVKDYVREDRKEHNEIVLHRAIFEVGYFGLKWNKYLDSLSRRSKKNTNKSNITKIGKNYYIQLGPDIIEETLDGQLREVMYKSELDPFVDKEVFAEMVVTDVAIPCSIVDDDKL